MRRVWVIGTSGSGKTTLAAELAEQLGVAHAELDGMHHGPGWAEPDPDEFRAAVAEVLAADGWVVDGSYRDKLGEMVPSAADTIVWLDPPLRVVMARLIGRSAGRIWHHSELWNGNRESIRGVVWGRESLLRWAVKRHREYRHELPALFAQPGYVDTRIVRLRSAADAERWLSTVAPVAQPPAGGS
jgi:adenylate kinase family enzyme